MSIIEERHELILKWIEEASDTIHEGLKNELDVERKSGRNDLVTNLDRKIEKELSEKIRKNFPNDSIISEEGYGDDLDSLKGNVWFIDPIDGTLNFVMQQKNYAIMIAVYEDGVGKQGYIYNVVEDRMYYAIEGQGAYYNNKKLPQILDKHLNEGMLACNSLLLTKQLTSKTEEIIDSSLGVRMIGSAGLETVEVATNSVVAFIGTRLKPWDIAAGKIIVEELGGKVSQLDGTDVSLLENNPTVFASPNAQSEVIQRLEK